jgi:multiple sugar transport system ATP-binding protein
VAVLKDGLLQQVASPRELYDRPANVFVAGFIGSPAMNLMQLPIVDGGVQLGDVVLPVGKEVLEKSSGSKVTVGIRPEKFEVSEHGLPATIDLVEELGSDGYLYGRSQLDGADVNLIIRTDPHATQLVDDQPQIPFCHGRASTAGFAVAVSFGGLAGGKNCSLAQGYFPPHRSIRQIRRPCNRHQGNSV